MWAKEAWKEHDMTEIEKKPQKRRGHYRLTKSGKRIWVHEHIIVRKKEFPSAEKEPTVVFKTDEFGVTHIIDLEKEGSVEKYFRNGLGDDDIDKFGE